MKSDTDIAFSVVVMMMLTLLTAVIAVMVITIQPIKRHGDTLPTTITESVKLPDLAQTKLLTEKLVTLAAAKAETYWNGTRCTSIKFLYRTLSKGVIAQAQWYSNSPASTHYLDCSITFNTDPTKVAVSFYHYCAALIHEYGHLAGLSHSKDRNNIMYPVLYNSNTPKTCKVKVYIAGLRF